MNYLRVRPVPIPVPAEMILTLEQLQESPIMDEQIRVWISQD